MIKKITIWHWAPIKFSGQSQTPGDIQIPLFLHVGLQIAGKKNVFFYKIFYFQIIFPKEINLHKKEYQATLN